MITAVLACAGEGRRFGAPYPKELHAIAPGVCLLDLALAPVLALAASGARIRLVAVLTPRRQATMERLAQLDAGVELLVTFQREVHGAGLAGAWRAAAPFCVGPTVLVLADQHYRPAVGADPLATALDELGGHEVAVIGTRTSHPDVLTADGALAIAGDPPVVTAAEDKPADPRGYNAVWASVACRAEVRGRLAALFDATATSPLIGAPVVLVDGYRNVSRPEDV